MHLMRCPLERDCHIETDTGMWIYIIGSSVPVSFYGSIAKFATIH